MMQNVYLKSRYNALLLICTSLLMFLILVPAKPLRAAADSADTTPVEERLKKQEQQIRDLQERLRQLESSTISGEVMERAEDGNKPSSAVSASLSSDRPDLGAVRETTKILTREELISDTFPGSWPMFGKDMRIKMGGYVKADAVFDFDGTTDKTQFLMRTIPVEGTPEYGGDSYFTAFAKETRINFDIRRTNQDAPPLRAFIEGDFWDSGHFRLRHAYITAGNFLVGQTWTTLSFLESLPYMIDFAAGDALFGGRSTQIRYTKAINDEWKLSIAAENLDFLGIENPNDFEGHATTQLPLLAVRADYRWDSGVLFLGSSIAQLHWDGGATGPSDDAMQFDIVVAGRQTIGEMNYATWNVGYGIGAGENIMAFAGSDANAVLEADGRLNTIPAFSAVLGFGHKWSPEWSSNFSYAYGWLDTPDTRAPFALKRGGIGHVNLVWDPDNPFSAAIEYMWGTQRVQNDAKGSASRLQLMTKFDF